jgi:hypothetical protein
MDYYTWGESDQKHSLTTKDTTAIEEQLAAGCNKGKLWNKTALLSQVLGQ